MVNILFFGRLKEQLQCGRLQLRIDTALSVKELKLHLVQCHPAWQHLLMDDQVLVAAPHLSVVARLVEAVDGVSVACGRLARIGRLQFGERLGPVEAAVELEREELRPRLRGGAAHQHGSRTW